MTAQHTFKKTWFDVIFRGVFGLFLVQNLLLVASFFISTEEGSGMSSSNLLFSLALYMDLIVFGFFALLALYMMIIRDKPLYWLLVLAGSVTFVLASITWRPIVGLFPENALSSTLQNIILPQAPPEPENVIDLSALRDLLNGLLFSNLGLLAFSAGLSLRIRNSVFQISMIIYGILNVLLVGTMIFIIAKPLVSILFVVIACLIVLQHPAVELLEPKKGPRKKSEPKLG